MPSSLAMVRSVVAVALAAAAWAAVGSVVDCLEAEAWAEEAVEVVGLGVAVGVVAVLEVAAMAWAARAVMVDPAALQSSQACKEVADAVEEETALEDWVVPWAEMEARQRAGKMAGVVGLRLVRTADGEGIRWVPAEATAAAGECEAGQSPLSSRTGTATGKRGIPDRSWGAAERVVVLAAEATARGEAR